MTEQQPRHNEPERRALRILTGSGFTLNGIGRYMSDDPDFVRFVGDRFTVHYSDHDRSVLIAIHQASGERFACHRVDADADWKAVG